MEVTLFVLLLYATYIGILIHNVYVCAAHFVHMCVCLLSLQALRA